MRSLLLGLLEAIDRRLGHRVDLLCHFIAYSHLPSHTWKEAGETMRLRIRDG